MIVSGLSHTTQNPAKLERWFFRFARSFARNEHRFYISKMKQLVSIYLSVMLFQEYNLHICQCKSLIFVFISRQIRKSSVDLDRIREIYLFSSCYYRCVYENIISIYSIY